MYACETYTPGMTPLLGSVLSVANVRHELTIDEWVYRHFDVCEINDGGFAHCFIEMPHGKVWGSSYNWVQTEEQVRFDSYED